MLIVIFVSLVHSTDDLISLKLSIYKAKLKRSSDAMRPRMTSWMKDELSEKLFFYALLLKTVILGAQH